jgi:hypothetical protein
MLQARGIKAALPEFSTNDIQSIWNGYPSDTQVKSLGSYDSAVNIVDGMASEFKSRKTRPDTLERNMTYGLYPDSEDPDFAAKLYRKKEYAMLQSEPTTEDACDRATDVFETTAVQRLVARFLSPMTPYRSLLLNHGVGVGKTCTAITVAEAFLEVMPNKKVYIIAPSAIAEGFKRTIFNPAALQRTTPEEQAATGHAWKSPQCTGMTYLELTGNTNNTNLEEIKIQVTRLINKRYDVRGYISFANMIKEEYKRVQQIQGHMTEDDKTAVLMRMFSDSLLIVDEAHNLRDADAQSSMDEVDAVPKGDETEPTTEVVRKVKAATSAAEGKAITPTLKHIAEVAEGMRLMLMTATPMYDTAPEILHLLNLLILNDTKDNGRQLNMNDVFEEGTALSDSGKQRLASEIKKYVSYMRGENINTFPLRLNPPVAQEESDVGTVSREFYNDEYVKKLATTRSQDPERKITLSDEQKNILAALPIVLTNVDSDSLVGGNLTTALAGDSGSMLDQIMQMGNMSFNDALYGTKGWDTIMKEETAKIGTETVKQYRVQDKYSGNSNFNLDALFGIGLPEHAPKVAKIVQSITKAEGMSFIYSRYVKAGALVVAAALELQGWCRVLPDGTPAPLLKRQRAPAKYKHYYVLLTGDNELSAPNIGKLVEYATTFNTDKEAEEGTRVKAIIGSQIASEGLDLKCIRELHILDGWYHLNRIEQIEGRGVRFCSHVKLKDKSKRNCLIYLHAINVPEYESADLYAYRIAVGKAAPIGHITRLIKVNAWDCMMNINAISLSGVGIRTIIDAQGRKLTDHKLQDMPYSTMCDFMGRCEYVCAAVLPTDVQPGTNMSTYKDVDFRRQVAEIQQFIVNRFAIIDDPYLNIEMVYDLLNRKDARRNKPLNIPKSVISYAIRNMIGTIRIQRKDNLVGTLVVSNGYLMFHPQSVTETRIPLSMRYSSSYGRIHDRMILTEPLFSIAAAQVEVVEEAPKITADAESLLEELVTWKRVVDQIVKTQYGPVEMPAKMMEPGEKSKKDTLNEFDGIRWVIHYFGALAEIKPAAYSWWMDHKWTPAERATVLKHWAVNGVSDIHTVFADCVRPNELFSGKYRGMDVSGYMETIIDGKKTSVKRYVVREKEVSEELDMDKESIDAVTKTIDRTNDTGRIYGIMSLHNVNIAFKVVDKDQSKKAGMDKGADCAGSTNLVPHRKRIREIQNIIRSNAGDSPFSRLLIVDTEGTADKPTQNPQTVLLHMLRGKTAPTNGDAKAPDPMQNLEDLTLKQTCPYMEFILRIMNLMHINDKQWFLSLTDLTRSPGTKEPKAKK